MIYLAGVLCGGVLLFLWHRLRRLRQAYVQLVAETHEIRDDLTALRHNFKMVLAPIRYNTESLDDLSDDVYDLRQMVVEIKKQITSLHQFNS